jgi:hypothetical protein
MKFAAATVFTVLSALTGVAPAAEPPAALVMDVSGSTEPTVTAMSEIASGTPLKLDAAARVTLLDYARCKAVTVSGGTITVTRFDFVTDGKIISETGAPCPRVHKLSANAGGAVAGGLVMRGLAAPPRWPLDREFVFAGDGGDKLAAAAIYADGRLDSPLLRLDVAGRRARVPAGAAPLPEGDKYVLRLTLHGRAEPVDISFIGAAPAGPSLLVVLREQ